MDILDVRLGESSVGKLTLLTGDRSFFAFEQAYQFMENELKKENLDPDYRNRLLWNKTQLELAELNLKQIRGEEPYVKCNKDPDFEIQEHEADFIFLILIGLY